MLFHAPGSLSFVLPIDTAPTWHLLPHPVAFRFGFVLLSRRSALGLLARTRLLVWEGFFLPLLGATVRTRTRWTPCCLRFAWFVPSCDFGILSPTLWFTPPVFGTSVSFPALLASRWALDFSLPPSGHARDPGFSHPHLWPWSFLCLVGGGPVGLVRFLGWLGAHAAIATVSSSFRFGFSFPGWVSHVVEGARGGFQAAVVIVFLACVG